MIIKTNITNCLIGYSNININTMVDNDKRFGKAVEKLQRDEDGNLVSDQRPAYLYVKMNNQES